LAYCFVCRPHNTGMRHNGAIVHIANSSLVRRWEGWPVWVYGVSLHNILRLPASQGAYGEQSFRGCPTAPAASARITEPEVSAYDENPSGKKQGQPCRRAG
jgi:hypothetical protein